MNPYLDACFKGLKDALIISACHLTLLIVVMGLVIASVYLIEEENLGMLCFALLNIIILVICDKCYKDDLRIKELEEEIEFQKEHN